MKTVLKLTVPIVLLFAAIAIANNAYLSVASTVVQDCATLAADGCSNDTLAVRTGARQARPSNIRGGPEQVVIAFRCSTFAGVKPNEQVWVTVYSMIDGYQFHMDNDSANIVPYENACDGWASGTMLISTIAETLIINAHNGSSDSMRYSVRASPRSVYTTDEAARVHLMDIGD